MGTPIAYLRNFKYLALCCDCKDLFNKEYVEFINECSAEEISDGLLEEEVFNRFLGYSFEIILTRWLRESNSYRTDFSIQSQRIRTIKGRLDSVKYLRKNNPFVFPCSYSVLSKNHHWNRFLIGAAIEAERASHTSVGFHRLVSSSFGISTSTTSTPKDIFQVKYSEWPYYEAPLLAAYIYLSGMKRQNAKSFPLFRVHSKKEDMIWQKWLEKRFLPDILNGFEVATDKDFKNFNNPSIDQWSFNKEYKESPKEGPWSFSQSTDMLIRKLNEDIPYCVVDAKNFDMQKEIEITSNAGVVSTDNDTKIIASGSKFSGPFHQIRSYMDHYSIKKGIVIYPIEADLLNSNKQKSELKTVKINLFKFQDKKVLFLGFSILEYFNRTSKQSIRSILQTEIMKYLND